MNNPEIGALNKRVSFELQQSVPNTMSGFDTVAAQTFEVWGRIEPVGAQIYWGTVQVGDGVTHRVYVRCIKGKTRPQDLTRLVDITCEGIRYRVMRVTDIAGEGRFTVIDVTSEGAAV